MKLEANLLSDTRWFKSLDEINMNNDCYEFITNFFAEEEFLYSSVAQENGIKFSIESVSYDCHGRKNSSNIMAFYVDSEIKGLAKFWERFRILKTQISSK